MSCCPLVLNPRAPWHMPAPLYSPPNPPSQAPGSLRAPKTGRARRGLNPSLAPALALALAPAPALALALTLSVIRGKHSRVFSHAGRSEGRPESPAEDGRHLTRYPKPCSQLAQST